MALTKCQECQKNMSDTLEACPHCGFKRVISQKSIPDENNNFCTQCGKPFDKDKNQCPYCNAKNITAQSTDKPIPNVSSKNTICNGCGKPYYKGAGKCPYCKTKNLKTQSIGNPVIDVSNLKSMIKCDCGNMYSIYTKKCPTCNKLNDNPKHISFVRIGIAVAVIILIIGLSIYNQQKAIDNVKATVISPNINISTEDLKKTYKIGERGPAGGWIFYDKGNSKGGWRYLEAAPEDQSTEVIWYNGKNIKTGAIGKKVGTGHSNTEKIILAQGNGLYAAKLCSDYYGGGKKDWFLPSKDELSLIYENLYKKGIGNLSSTDYWSSSEYELERVCYQDFNNGLQDEGYKDFSLNTHVRAVRAF